jgi:hypothetical protein
MKSVAERIVSIRQQICPRTSYATSGTASSMAIMIAEQAMFQDPATRSLIKELMNTEDFERIEERDILRSETNYDDIHGHVIISVNCGEDGVNSAMNLMKNKKTNLVFFLVQPSLSIHIESLKDGNKTNDAEKIMNMIHKIKDEKTIIVLDNFSINNQKIQLITSHVSLCAESLQSNVSGSDNTKTIHGKGYNNQPSVQSKLQFKYLWSLNSPADGKNRILQRLADKELKSGIKYNKEKWESLIQILIDKNCNDFHIYDMLRKNYIGKSLDESLKIDIRSINERIEEREIKVEAVNEDGRANFLVDMTLQCIPVSMQKNIHTLLDYGCAEGAITAQLCRKLGVLPSHAYGADVRSLKPSGFTFVLLPAEGVYMYVYIYMYIYICLDLYVIIHVYAYIDACINT